MRTYRREYRETWPIIQQILRLGDDRPGNMSVLSLQYLMEGDYAKVIEIGNEIQSSEDKKSISDYLTANLAAAYARTGQQARARQLLAYLEQRAKTESETAYRLATAYSDLGRKDEAIVLLKGCFAAHDDRMVWIKAEPRFDPLRDDARFQEMLRSMNLSG